MKTHIALFRGINVGGRNTLPMKELVLILEDLECENVRTYIQSGNAVFDSNERDSSRLSTLISTEIGKRRGFKPHILLKSVEKLERAIAKNPFPEGEKEPQALHLGFLVSEPQQPDLKRLENLREGKERFQLIDDIFYLYAPDGVGRSKLAASAERSLGVAMTDRNWRTVCKIQQMAKQGGGDKL